MEFASKLKHSGLPVLLINQELFGKRSYNVQPRALLADIRNYSATYALTKQLYQGTFGKVSVEGGADNWDDWWSNDVYGWGNNNAPTQDGYTEKMYKLWKVFVPLWCNNMLAAEYFQFTQVPQGRRPIHFYKIDCFLSSYLNKKTNIQQIHRFWGAMTPADRKSFIEMHISNISSVHAGPLFDDAVAAHFVALGY
jgi:hypothetical protein